LVLAALVGGDVDALRAVQEADGLAGRPREGGRERDAGLRRAGPEGALPDRRVAGRRRGRLGGGDGGLCLRDRRRLAADRGGAAGREGGDQGGERRQERDQCGGERGLVGLGSRHGGDYPTPAPASEPPSGTGRAAAPRGRARATARGSTATP